MKIIIKKIEQICRGVEDWSLHEFDCLADAQDYCKEQHNKGNEAYIINKIF